MGVGAGGKDGGWAKLCGIFSIEAKQKKRYYPWVEGYAETK